MAKTRVGSRRAIRVERVVTLVSRRCEECRELFESVRSDARFCRPYCRLKSHRRRERSERDGDWRRPISPWVPGTGRG